MGYNFATHFSTVGRLLRAVLCFLDAVIFCCFRADYMHCTLKHSILWEQISQDNYTRAGRKTLLSIKKYAKPMLSCRESCYFV